MMAKKSGAKFDVCYVPENLRLGEALNSFLKPDRIVIGANKDATMKKVKKLFEPIRCEKIGMSVESAEMAKHALNAYLATCISFINEISDICELSGASAVDVVKALKTDRRVSPYAPIKPGLGFSGGTLARDVQVLRKYGGMKNYRTKVLDAVMQVNDERAHFVRNKLEKLFGSLKSIRVGILGLTYKPGTDTLRRSLSLEIARDLISRGAAVKAFDPRVKNRIPGLPELEVCRDVSDVASGSDVLVLLTEWPEFRGLRLEKIKTIMRRPIFFDAKNFLEPEEFKKLKFKYIGVGYEA
jgi:UDPglucose 6-dehydrogenase